MRNKQDKSLIYDLIRKDTYVSSPEEKVRQKLILLLTQKKGFPSSLLVIEQKISHLPHLRNCRDCPNRRLDILCYWKAEEMNSSLFPLILIECKAKKIEENAVKQVIGYNYFVKAPFIGLASEQEFLLGKVNCEGGYFFSHTLPSYERLIRDCSEKMRVS